MTIQPTRSRLRSRAAGIAAALTVAAATVLVPVSAASALTQDTQPPPTPPPPSAMLPAQDTCIGKTGILVASDRQAQSDVYAAAALQGAVDGCLIWAGHRDHPMDADQLQRSGVAARIGYVIGSSAAISVAKADTAAAQADSDTAYRRIGGEDRFETARLVGAEIVRAARDGDMPDGDMADGDMADSDMPDSDMPDGDMAPAADAAADLGALSGNRSHTSPVGQTDVAATLAQARWRITAQSDVPAGKRLDAAFAPAVTLGSCFAEIDGPGDATDKHKFVWNIKAGSDSGCDNAENRAVSVSTAAGDLDDYSDGGDGEPDWGWRVSFERRPAVNVPAPSSVTASTRETLTPTVNVPAKGDKTTRQVLRLGQGSWLLHVIDQAAGGLSGSAAKEMNAAKYGVSINDVAVIFPPGMYDDSSRYDDDRFRCVAVATAETITAGGLLARWGDDIKVVAPSGGGKYMTDDSGTAVALGSVNGSGSAASDALAVTVPSGCAGYVAIQVATPAGTSGDDGADDVKRWRVQAVPLAAAAG